jgi:hypothetical protein
MPSLVELGAKLTRITPQGAMPELFELSFRCPAHPRGTVVVQCWRGPPAHPRWHADGESLVDLTVTPSVKVPWCTARPNGCDGHWEITNGQVVPSK